MPLSPDESHELLSERFLTIVGKFLVEGVYHDISYLSGKKYVYLSVNVMCRQLWDSFLLADISLFLALFQICIHRQSEGSSPDYSWVTRATPDVPLLPVRP